MDQRHEDHGLFYERHGQLRRGYAEDLEDEHVGQNDALAEPDWGAPKQETQAAKDLIMSLIDEQPGTLVAWNSKHMKVLDEIEHKLLRAAAYVAAVRLHNSRYRR